MKMLALGPMGAQGPEQGMIAARPVCPVDRYAPESLMTIEFSVTNNVFARDILTVAQLNRRGQLLERSIPAIWVRGDFQLHAGGFRALVLHDQGQPRRRAGGHTRSRASGGVRPRAGDQVEIRARVSLYEPRGDYQLQVDAMRRAGLGNLYEAFLRLKEQLAFEGLFDPARKRELAPLPRAIGVITSLHAARAMCCRHWPGARRKFPSSSIRPRCRAPTRPAGWPRKCGWPISAPKWIPCCWCAAAAALKISGDDEALAREVAASAIPVVSGVGHETDFTIVDFVADLRAHPDRGGGTGLHSARRAAGPRHGRGARWRAASSGGWSGPPSASTAPPASWCRRRSAWNISASA